MDHLAVMLAVSMLLASSTVKSEAKNSIAPKKSKATQEAQLKTAQLVEFLQRAGKDDILDDMKTAERLGFSTEMPVRVVEVDTPRSIKGWRHRETAVVYAPSDQSSDSPSARTPVCVYFYQTKATGHDNKGYWFRLSLQGTLEKALLTIGKNDDAGTPIRGSGVQIEQDIESAEVKKAFDAELSYWTDWITKQRRPDATPAP